MDNKIRVTVRDEKTRDAVTTQYATMGDISDGYHSFDELYRYRALYNAAFFNAIYAEYTDHDTEIGVITKSHNHSDGTPAFGGGWFVVTAQLPTGQITNHYEDKYWDLFKVLEADKAPEWDGHTPEEAADRLEKYLAGNW